MAKRKIRTRFWVFLFALLAVIALIILLVSNGGGNSNTVEWGEIRIDKTFDAVIARDEQVVNSEKYGKINFAVSEGESVTAGTKIAEVFKSGYNDEILQSLLTTQKDIIEYQTKMLDGVVNAQLEKINYDIRLAASDIRDVATGKSQQNMLNLEQKLKTLLEQRMECLKSISQTDESLEALYQKETEQLNTLAQWRIEMTAEKDGIVSFYLDGYDQAVNASNVLSASVQTIKDILVGKKLTTQDMTETGTPLYRLINDQRWYCVFVTDQKTADGLASSGEYTVSFDGYYSKTFAGTIVSKTLTDDGVIVTIEFNEAIGSFIDVRCVRVNLKRNVEGAKVPLSAINNEEDGSKGIYLVEGSEKQYVKVDILVADSDYAIIESKDSGVQILPQQKFVKP
jgi:putative membrane fusion protein